MPEVSGVDSESPGGKRIDERRTEIFEERYLPSLEPFPRAAELLARLRADGFRLVVASSAKKEEMDALLEICGGSKLVDERTSSDDAEQSKPDGDIVEAALSRPGAQSHEALMLGDAPYDVEAARRVGVRTVALRSGPRSPLDVHCPRPANPPTYSRRRWLGGNAPLVNAAKVAPDAERRDVFGVVAAAVRAKFQVMGRHFPSRARRARATEGVTPINPDN